MRVLAAALAAGVLFVGAFAATPARAGEDSDDGALRPAEVALAKQGRPSVARVRWRDARFGDYSSTRNAVVVRRDGLLLMAGVPPSRRGTFTAVLADGRELRATVVGSDAQTALTLLRVGTTGLTPIPGASAPTPKAGEPTPRPDLAPPALGTRLVMVTGDGAVAAGPVRAHGRHGRYVDPRSRASQRTTALVGVAIAAVDADAGAPLLRANGRLAGLVVGRKDTAEQPARRTPRREGLRTRPTPVEVVAVPAGVVQLVWPLLERHGRLPRAALGVDTKEADEAFRKHLALETGGHVVQRVVPGGAAARDGLRRHDVLVAVGGRSFPPGTTLHDVLLPFRPGTRTEVTVIRGGARQTLPVVLGER